MSRRVLGAEGAARGGFTLLEVVLAMGILLLGLTAVLGLLSFGAALSRHASLRAAGAQSIDAVVADLERSLFPLGADGRAGEPVAVEERPVPGHAGLVYSARAVPNAAGPLREGAPLEYKVEVELSWTSRGAKRSRRITTLLLREVPFAERMRLYAESVPPRTAESGPR